MLLFFSATNLFAIRQPIVSTCFFPSEIRNFKWSRFLPNRFGSPFKDASMIDSTGRGLPKPKGSNSLNSSIACVVTCDKLTGKSTLTLGVRSSSDSDAATTCENLSRNLGMLSFVMLNPAAALCPPKPSIKSLHSFNPSKRLNSGMLRPEPCPSSPFSAISNVGR